MDSNFYLRKLVIQNFATFKNQTINFKPGFNAIIGETGSGKSLVLDALQLILGGRADKKVVRRETEYALIEASFYCSDEKVKQFLEGEGFPIEGKEIIIKRLIYKNGITKNYLNHLSCTVTFLTNFSRKFIDLVGQFENQKLLSEPYQLYLLDQYSNLLSDLHEYQSTLKELKKIQHESDQLKQNKSQREQRLDYLNYQLDEIQKLNPSTADEEHLIQKKCMLINFEKNQKLLSLFNQFFNGNEHSSGLFDNLRQISSLVSKNSEIFSEQLDLINDIEEKVFSLNNEVDKKLSADVDPTELVGVLERLDDYQKLKKKFGGSVESILQTQVDFLKEKNHLENLDMNLNDIEQSINRLIKELKLKGESLHKARLLSSKKFSEDLTHKVRSLKMDGATINLAVEKTEDLTETGISKLSFLAETNPGEGYYKIKEIASGGELSRILLGLRQILSSHESISIFLFDEIDTGIGGETANCIGKALSDVAMHGQVIAITHLPQIAQFADALVIVSKAVQSLESESRTESIVKEIYGKTIIKEVRAMAQLS